MLQDEEAEVHTDVDRKVSTLMLKTGRQRHAVLSLRRSTRWFLLEAGPMPAPEFLFSPAPKNKKIALS